MQFRFTKIPDVYDRGIFRDVSLNKWYTDMRGGGSDLILFYDDVGDEVDFIKRTYANTFEYEVENNLEVDKDNFQIGDVVQLKSGGPRMTVKSSNRVGHIECIWFTDKDELSFQQFEEETLNKIGDK